MTNQNDTIDALILSTATGEWVKINVIIAAVFDAPEFAGLDCSAQDVAARLYILVDNGQLAVQGNMRRWREGEVKKI